MCPAEIDIYFVTITFRSEVLLKSYLYIGEKTTTLNRKKRAKTIIHFMMEIGRARTIIKVKLSI